jgi:organic hydroperoxide reductase OsmC/OhrA
MQPFPHRYLVDAAATVAGDVSLDSERLTSIPSAPPVEFGGPGDRWSPETLLVASVADCFVLTFRAIAAMSKLNWLALQCQVTGIVDRVERVAQFTEFTILVSLRVPAATDGEQARRLLEKAKQTCLVSNSLKAESRLETRVEVVP